MKITKSRLKQIIKEEYEDILRDDEFATAAGMEQDIEMRRKRGDFEKGDWGVHGSLGYSDKGGMAGEYSDYGEYPWIKSALENLKDGDQMNKEKAVEMLAQELGVSIVTRQEADDALDL
tara:strand:- start:94 stop:450 length:357 start_codon:yes stop_codon:yes gene_type:complete